MENDAKLRSAYNDIDIEGLDEFSAHVPLREVVARTLKRAILDGSLRPGQPISENKIANKLSVSRTPVREAVRMLETENLVTLLPGRKVIISIPTVQDIEDVYETRLIIESEALRRITPDQKELMQELEEYTRVAQEHLKRGDFIELEKVNTSLHLAVLSALENRTIREFMASLHNNIARLRAYSLTDRKWAAEWEREHQLIIAHLKKGETERAVDILHQHLITPKQLLINMFSERSGSDGSG
jgi:DNA-binding GntR family transcriptional regulator